MGKLRKKLCRRQRSRFFRQVGCYVVDARNTRLVAADVIQLRLLDFSSKM
jgi:hypothetical protein